MNISITESHSKHRDLLLLVVAAAAPPGSARDIEAFARWLDAGMFGEHRYENKWFEQVLVPATEVWWAAARDMPVTADDLLLNVQDAGWRQKIKMWIGREK
jgi:hypothetical protein